YIKGWVVRLRGAQVGLVLEACEKDGYRDLSSFVESCAMESVDSDEGVSAGRVGHTTQAGALLEMMYDGEHCVNGEPIDYGAWKLYDAPEVQAELNSGVVRFAHGGESLTLDFAVDPDGEMIPMRVIG
ncbi:MAG: hypothetical protein ACKVJG_15725, partial [Candidatus Latescibacterota bacterium]